MKTEYGKSFKEKDLKKAKAEEYVNRNLLSRK